MPLSLKQRIGFRVKASREQAGMTQEQLAVLIDRTPETVSNIERGQTLPSLETLENLSRHLKRPLRDFVDDDDATRAVGRRRFELETRMESLLRTLSDQDLEVAVKQVEALASARQ